MTAKHMPHHYESPRREQVYCPGNRGEQTLHEVDARIQALMPAVSEYEYLKRRRAEIEQDHGQVEPVTEGWRWKTEETLTFPRTKCSSTDDHDEHTWERETEVKIGGSNPMKVMVALTCPGHGKTEPARPKKRTVLKRCPYPTIEECPKTTHKVVSGSNFCDPDGPESTVVKVPAQNPNLVQGGVLTKEQLDDIMKRFAEQSVRGPSIIINPPQEEKPRTFWEDLFCKKKDH